jgi:predicted esterase
MIALLVVSLIFVLPSIGSPAQEDAGIAAKLKSYNVEAGETSVSGLSSGAYMAVQFHVAFSSTLRGAGVTAGGPFYCAQGQLTLALSSCANAPALIPVAQLVALTKFYAAFGSIDPTFYLGQSRVFLISGTKDAVIVPGVMEKLRDYYSNFVESGNIGRIFSIPAGHGQLSNVYGSKCDTAVVPSPYIVNCNYPSGFMILQHIYGDIQYADDTAMIAANLLDFDQSEFFRGFPGLVSMDTTGYVYVPTQCLKGAACRLHIAFHGCRQNRGSIGDVFSRHAGYNGVAEVNNIIVLYPQVVKTNATNPQGCWDWWGYTGPLYGVKAGLQMAGAKKMLDRIAQS